MANRTRPVRWLLFFTALFCFFYVVIVDATTWSVGGFFASGLLWYWLERRKMRELDAPGGYTAPRRLGEK